MSGRINIFLSHIDEETELAKLLKTAIEEEFAGFVDVFSFSDANLNPAGGNIIRNIEAYLSSAAAGIFLLSPVSLRRPWINFELGALWMRNVFAAPLGRKQMPLVPICHSRLGINDLPMPISELNAITGSASAELRKCFEAIQGATGGRGALRTDFTNLAAQVNRFERSSTVGSAFCNILTILCKRPLAEIIRDLDTNANRAKTIGLKIDKTEQHAIDKVIDILNDYELRDVIHIEVTQPTMGFTRRGVVNSGNVAISFASEFYQSIRDTLDALV